MLRAAAPNEAAKILAFYQENADENILPRPEEELAKAAERGLFYIVEINERIVAAAGVFELSPIVKYLEAGSCLVLDEVRGFGVQRLLLRTRLAAVAANYGSDTRVISAVKPSNGSSKKNVLASSFVPWNDPIPEVIEPCVTCPSKPSPSMMRVCCCDFYIIPEMDHRALVGELTSLKDWSELPKNDGRSLHVRFKCKLLTDPTYLGILREFAAGKSW